MPKRTWLSFVSKHKKQGVKLDDLIYALARTYLLARGIDWTIEHLHQFALNLIGNSFEYGLARPVLLSQFAFNPEPNFDLKKIGHTYECWRHLDRPDIQARIQTANKSIDADLLIGFTQIYTPEWVVQYLIDKTILESNATIIDPACGTGNFILSAFDKLHQDGASAIEILEKQISATDIDQTALSICALTLAIRLIELGITSLIDGKLMNFRLLDLDQTKGLGSLYRDFDCYHPLSSRHDAVLANPPYIGRKLMSKSLKASLKLNYADSHQDMSAAFLSRCLELTVRGGKTGMITQASLLNLPAFDKLRRDIIDNYNLVSVVDAGIKVFPLVPGEKVNSALIVIEKPLHQADSENRFFEFSKLTRLNVKSKLELSQESLKTTYRLSAPAPEEVLQLMQLPALENYAHIKQGLATTDNARFVKLIGDVDASEMGSIWFPYVKGAGATRWFAPVVHAIDWQDNGKRIKETVQQKYPYLNGKSNWVVKNESFYFKPGICFSFVSTKGVSFRKLFAGAIFDVGASAIFVYDETIDSDFLLAYLNSSLCVSLLQYINPTINNQVGDVRRLPVIPMDQIKLSENANRLVQLCKQKLDCMAEERDSILGEIKKLETENDFLVLQAAQSHFNWSEQQTLKIKDWYSRDELIPLQNI